MCPSRAAALLLLLASPLLAQTPPICKKFASAQSTQKQLSPSDELQQTIESACNDRAALVRNLEGYLQEYLQAPERLQVFRAHLEACLHVPHLPKAPFQP